MATIFLYLQRWLVKVYLVQSPKSIKIKPKPIAKSQQVTLRKHLAIFIYHQVDQWFRGHHEQVSTTQRTSNERFGVVIHSGDCRIYVLGTWHGEIVRFSTVDDQWQACRWMTVFDGAWWYAWDYRWRIADFGLIYRINAFILAGMMAVAYFYFHSGFDLIFNPIVNKGEAAALYCMVF